MRIQSLRSSLVNRRRGIPGGCVPFREPASGPDPFFAGMETVEGTMTGPNVTLTFSSLTDATQCIPLFSTLNATALPGFDYGDKRTFSISVYDDAGTVKAYCKRALDDDSDIVVRVTLVEFTDALEVTKSLFDGTVTTDAAGGANVTIPAVNHGSAFVVGSFEGANVSSVAGASLNVVPHITSNTNVHIRTGYLGLALDRLFLYTVSDPTGDILTVTSTAGTHDSDSVQSPVLTVPTMDLTKTLIIAGVTGPSNSGMYPERNCYSAEVLSATQVRFNRHATFATSNDFYTKVQAVEFAYGASTQQGFHAWASADRTETKSITAVGDLAASVALSTMPSCPYNASNSAGFVAGYYAFAFNRVKLANDSQVQLDRYDDSGADVGGVGYQVIEFT